MPASSEYVVHGVTASYFTRKVTGYLDHKRLPWWLSPDAGAIPVARAAGWNGGIPAVVTPQGELIWDSTAVILHLDHHHPERGVAPPDPVLRFLDFVLEDFADEWLYRHAVGTRWLIDENRATGSWDIARDASFTTELPAELAARSPEAPPAPGIDAVRAFVTDAMTGCLPRLGVTPENLDGWVEDSLLPWMRALQRHLAGRPFLFGGRPSLADLALFGGDVAHFVSDPVCRRWTEAAAPAVVTHTHLLATARGREPGAWMPPGEVPDTLVALLAETARHYQPWVTEATAEGAATVRFADGRAAHIATTGFLTEARGVLLARYVAARTPELDAVLERAGLLPYFAGQVTRATAVPDPAPPPRPDDNRPFPAGP